MVRFGLTRIEYITGSLESISIDISIIFAIRKISVIQQQSRCHSALARSRHKVHATRFSEMRPHVTTQQSNRLESVLAVTYSLYPRSACC